MPGGPGVGDIILQAAQGIVAMHQGRQRLALQERQLDQQEAASREAAQAREEGLRLREQNAQLQEERMRLNQQKFEAEQASSAAAAAESKRRFELNLGIQQQRVDFEAERLELSKQEAEASAAGGLSVLDQQSLLNKRMDFERKVQAATDALDADVREARFSDFRDGLTGGRIPADPEIRGLLTSAGSFANFEGAAASAQRAWIAARSQLDPRSPEYRGKQATAEAYQRASNLLHDRRITTTVTASERQEMARLQGHGASFVESLSVKFDPKLAMFDALGADHDITEKVWKEQVAAAFETKNFGQVLTQMEPQILNDRGLLKDNGALLVFRAMNPKTPQQRKLIEDILIARYGK